MSTINNSYYTLEEVKELGLNKFGSNVLISRKSSIYGASQISLGSNVRIDDFCILSGKILLGSYIHIAAYSCLYGGQKGIIINDYSNISSKVSIYSVSDDYTGESMTNPMVPDKYKNVTQKEVIIEKHVVVGSGCVILPGARLKLGSAFGAMTLINRDSEEWSINVGIPFRKIKEREKQILSLEKEFICE